MKHLLLTTIAAVVLVGCGPSVPDISIHEAARGRNIEAVKQHLAAGTDVNVKDRLGVTPLISAVSGGDKEIVEFLIIKGANVNVKDLSVFTPLHHAVLSNFKEIAELLIANGADVNVNAEYGITPLHDSAAFGHKKVAELLIANGANVDAMDKGGNTPLGYAIGKGRTETADLLRKHGAKTGEELKSSVSTDDLETYTLSEPEGTISTLVINPDGSFRESLGFRAEAKRPENTLIGSWKIEGELLVLEGTTELDSKQTIIKFNKTTGKIVSINSNGNEVPTEELGRLTIKKN